TRLAVWQWTMDYAKTHPMGGGFEAYRQNHIRYEKVAVESDGAGQATVGRSLEVDKARAYHSAYFEMLGEQGYPGLALWLTINLLGIFRMEVLRQRYRKPEPGQEWVAPLASALQTAHIVYMLGATFIAIAFQPFVYM
ncbi:putative O-glycosylation ligase, exosortase A system-associated, partial [Pandoraea nosoerga]|nr:putative O-glycosylation ligase, exosortase A system-associated [Pandoraea nosoerga]